MRDPGKLELSSPLLEKIQGDVTDYGSLLSFLTGSTCVISVLSQAGNAKPVHSSGTSNIIKAMKVLGIRRFILVTGLTLDVPGDKKSLKTRIRSGMMNLLFPSVIADKRNEFALLPESGLDWTVVRLPLIELTGPKGTLRSSLLDCPGSRISASDLAEFLAGQIDDRRFIGKCPFVSN